MSAADRQQLTFRERQLLDAFRQCDERGRALLESLAANQVLAVKPVPATHLQRVK